MTKKKSKNYKEEELKEIEEAEELEELEEEGQLSIDVYQDAASIYIKSTIAGVEPDGIDISFDNDMITIRGRRAKDEMIREEDYFYQECYWGGFSRSIILPVDVQEDKIKATIRNGILTVELPKAKKKDTNIKIKNDN
ncbi:MAG: Hsp20/alpha crystallin family protein [Candidatus Komeilibacteria bacterium]|jgi:HSP20 family protein|nr:Hsp20/alpha crystallin family protein [Candidatus Komeilibacteria bacterium]MBT4447199.1 Hsp20/alpha crystallin family protein [Candidatus Komeilibacteria bacterium]